VGTATQLQSTVDQAAHRKQARDARTLAGLQAPSSVPALHVQAGVTGNDASLNQFFPSTLQVHSGQTVTWDNHSTTPHVVIFGEATDPAVAIFSPPTAPSGSDYGGGPFITGPIAVPAYPTTSFSLTFNCAGSYSYVCTFHPGMAGTINVDP
jgi:plastocyanin